MSILAKVTNTAPNLPSRVVLYAAEKWGKSSFAAYTPKPIFLMTAGETGLLSLIEVRKVPAVDHFPDDFQTWQGLVNAVRALRDEKHDFQTLVLDTGNGAENLAADAVCVDKFGGDWSDFNAYGRGIDLTVPEWAKFLALLDDLRIHKRMGILFLHHARVKTFSDPAGKQWDQWRPEAVAPPVRSFASRKPSGAAPVAAEAGMSSLPGHSASQSARRAGARPATA